MVAEGIADKASPTAILVKVNQIGSLTETLAAVEMSHKARFYCSVMSASLRRDRRRDHRRSRRGHQLRADQNRIPGPFGPACQIQPIDSASKASCWASRGAMPGAASCADCPYLRMADHKRCHMVNSLLGAALLDRFRRRIATCRILPCCAVTDSTSIVLLPCCHAVNGCRRPSSAWHERFDELVDAQRKLAVLQ